MSANNPVKTNKPLDWLTTLNLSEEVKDLLFETIKNGDGLHGKGNFVMLVDPTTNPMKAGSTVRIGDGSGTASLAAVIQNGADSGAGNLGLMAISVEYVSNVAASTIERVRTPTIFKVSLFTIGSASVAAWTPVAGKKFRCMGALISVTDNIAEGALDVSGIYLKDGGVGGTAFAVMNAFIPAATLATAAGAIVFPISFQVNGYLSTAVNQVLQLGLYSAANLTAGSISGSFWGTEE